MAKRSLSDLPEGMITEIFVRLPVKSVLICKSVCKPWLSTISDPDFVKYQLQRKPSALLVIKKIALRDEKRGKIMTLDMSPVQINSLVMPSMFSAFPVVGSCNGIVCLENVSNNAIYLWNPSIRQYKRIYAPFRRQDNFGFGFDSVSNDYKVICIVHKTWTAVIVPEVFVYSANADSWRHFQDPALENLRIHRDCNVVVKGVLYFDNWNELISFNLHKEVFGLISFPSLNPRKRSYLLDFEGSVALFFQSDGNGPEFDLWTLDDASDQVSWSKKCSINLITLYYEWSIYSHCYLGAGLFWGLAHGIRDGFHYILYNSEKREAKNYGLREERVHVTLKYMETLVTLDGFQQVE